MGARPGDVSGWPWADELDAMVAAPEYHRLLLENERVRVLEVQIAAGATVPLHCHRWPSVMIIQSASDFLRRDGDGRVTYDTRNEPPEQNTPGVIWSPPLPPHSVENIGAAEIHIVSVEIKQAGS
jgi:hypothetical protein